MKRTIRKSMTSRLSLKKMVIADLNPAAIAQIKGGQYDAKNTGGHTTLGGMSIYSGYLGTNCPLKTSQKWFDDNTQQDSISL